MADSRKKLTPLARAEVRAAEAHASLILTRERERARVRAVASQWVAQVCSDLSSLVEEVQRVHAEARRDGSLLGDVLDPTALVRVLTQLEGAESRAGALRAAGVRSADLPDLVEQSQDESSALSDAKMTYLDAQRILLRERAVKGGA